MTGREWSLVEVHDVIAEAVPDRDMLVCGDVRRTFGEVAARSRGLAAFLRARGLGVRTERADLERWEAGQDTVALLLDNGTEYVEAMLGAYRARAAPFNVNQHYRPGEVAALFADLAPRAVILHRRLAPLLTAAVDTRDLVLIEVDDDSSAASLAGATPYEVAVATPVDDPLPAPSPDDLYLVCTGGTTGKPKAVLWRQADVYVSAMGGSEDATPESIAAAALGGGGAWFAMPPLMHGSAQWTAFGGLHQGATIVVHDDRGAFDAAAVLRIAEAQSVRLLTIVGDAHARPIVEELRRGDYDLSSLGILATGGAATNEQHKVDLLEMLPDLMIVDGYGASETGGMAFGARTRHGAPTGFNPAAGAAVVSDDRTRFLEPGDEEVGWTARRGRVPLGYLNDRAKTEATFPIVDGVRLSVPGDRARRLADGAIEMLGRDSLVINTGGEKVFVEEVEEVLRRHAAVADALVVGRPSERFGTEVVAVVALRPGATATPAELRDAVGQEIARYKAPRAVAFVDAVQRLANGKADYGWAREVSEAAAPATKAG